MPKHMLGAAIAGILVMPGLLIAGYPDVPRSHWAAPAVDKVAQSGVMTSRSDGRFHGTANATRYEVASAVARAMAELENRLIAEGKSPEDIVPYIERINLYVADEIDHLKQSQKELRATVNELMERLERREAHSTPLPPPCPPMAHPHASMVPMTELRQKTDPAHDQRIHPVEGAAQISESTTVTEHTQVAISKIRARVAEGKVSAVEGAAPIARSPEAAAEDKALRESFLKRASGKTPSDESAWQNSQSSMKDDEDKPEAIEQVEKAEKPAKTAKIEKAEKIDKSERTDEAAAAQLAQDEQMVEPESNAQIESKPAATPKADAPKKAAKPMQTSMRPRTAPHGLGGGIETAHGAMAIPESAPVPFSSMEHDAAPVAKALPAGKATAKIETALIATAKPVTADEMLGSPDIAPGDGPSDEQLSNWTPGSTSAVPAATPSTTAAAAVDGKASLAPPGSKQVYARSSRAQSLLAELRSRKQ